MQIFGHYLHHYPYVGITDGLAKVGAVFEKTRQLFRAEYAEELMMQNAGEQLASSNQG